MDESSHLDLVDAFGGQEVLAVGRMRQVWTELNRYQRKLAGLHGDQRERSACWISCNTRWMDEEGRRFAGDEKNSSGRHKLLLNARKLVEICGTAIRLVDGTTAVRWWKSSPG